jgi:hypothetical protein
MIEPTDEQIEYLNKLITIHRNKIIELEEILSKLKSQKQDNPKEFSNDKLE